MNMDKNQRQWSDEEVQQQFYKDVRARFEAENAAYQAMDRHGIDKLLLDDPNFFERNEWAKDAFGIRNSFLWEILEGCQFSYHFNRAEIVLPEGFAIGADVVNMFSNTAVAWGLPSISAKIIDGQPRLVIDVLLIDFWSDERQREWEEEQLGKEWMRLAGKD